MGIASLDAALSGLRVSQQQISLISNNVANASTPGYSRKILPQSSITSQGITVGVVAENAIRNVDITLERDLWTQVSSVEFFSIQDEYLTRVEQFHGPPDANISISAIVTELQSSFTSLADSPENTLILSGVVDDAVNTANKINEFGDLMNTLRSDIQNEISLTVSEINALLEQIADFNVQIENANIGNRSVADLSDLRSESAKQLSELIEISFFTRGDGTMVVQTNEGVELASERFTPLFFDTNPVDATSTYPDNINGIFIGDPNQPFSVDITEDQPGGKLGGLLVMRDETLPQYSAQMDEFAHKLALRFEAQGLRLFTDQTSNIPADTPPDPTTIPPTAVSYVGFSSEIRVNEAILADNSIVQRGTANTDNAVQPGSNEVLRRVVEFVFGDTDFQQATGTIDMRSNATGGVDIHNWLGLTSSNTITGGRDLSAFATVADMTSILPGLTAPTEEFQITFEEPRTGLGPATITVNLTAADLQPGANALERIVAEIDAQIAALPVPAGLFADAAEGANGEIVLNSAGSITIDGAFGATGIQEAGLNQLGLNGGTYTPQDPYFDVRIGKDPIQRIFIEPGDTEAELIDKLILNSLGDAYNAPGDTTGVPGLAYDETTFLATGELILRPGEDYDTPEFGGDILLVPGPFDVDPTVAASADIAALGAGNGVNVISALFGSFNPGPPSENITPVSSVLYGSEINGSAAIPRPTSPFRENFLGPNADLDTGIVGATNLINFAQRIINRQSSDMLVVDARIEDESSLKNLLETELLNESGVNIDEELANLIVYQTAYSAAARVVSAVEELFDELLRAL